MTTRSTADATPCGWCVSGVDCPRHPRTGNEAMGSDKASEADEATRYPRLKWKLGEDGLAHPIERTSGSETAQPCAATKLVDGLEYVCRAGVAHAGCASGLHAWQLVDPKDWRALYRACVAQLSALAEIVGNTNGDPEVTIGIVRSLAAMGRERASGSCGSSSSQDTQSSSSPSPSSTPSASGTVRDAEPNASPSCGSRATLSAQPCGREAGHDGIHMRAPESDDAGHTGGQPK